MKYLKEFETVAAYNAAKPTLDLPNVSLIDETNGVAYEKLVPPQPETRLICVYNISEDYIDTDVYLMHGSYGQDTFESMEVDGVELKDITNTYRFKTSGNHTVKYTLTNTSSIGNGTFYSCSNLVSVTIPSCVTSIGDDAFRNCYSLTNINIPNSVTSIGNGAFNDCNGLTNINIPNSVTSIGEYAFNDCTNLTSCTIGGGVTKINEEAFLKCESLTSITCNAMTAPDVSYSINPVFDVAENGTLYVPNGSTGYDAWMQQLATWTKVEQ